MRAGLRTFNIAQNFCYRLKCTESQFSAGGGINATDNLICLEIKEMKQKGEKGRQGKTSTNIKRENENKPISWGKVKQRILNIRSDQIRFICDKGPLATDTSRTQYITQKTKRSTQNAKAIDIN